MWVVSQWTTVTVVVSETTWVAVVASAKEARWATATAAIEIRILSVGRAAA